MHTTLIAIYKNAVHITAFQTTRSSIEKNLHLWNLWNQSKKLHIQIKTDIKNTVMQALLKIWNILPYITSEKNTDTVFPTLDSNNLIGTSSTEDISELSLWLLWRYIYIRSNLAQQHGRNMSLLKSDHTWTRMPSLKRLESQTNLSAIST